MDKDMLDQDLNDIMKEIEALERDFREEEKAFAKSPVIQELAQLNEELSAPVGQASSDETFDWLREENNNAEPLHVEEAQIFEMKAAEVKPAEVKPAPVAAAPSPVASSPAPSKPAVAPVATHQHFDHSKMSFQFPEGTPLNVEFQVGEKCISLCWSEDSFHVEMEGGISFTIPVTQYLKKVS